MVSRSQRKLNAQDTVLCLNAGEYTLPSGEKISLQPDLERAMSGTEHYQPNGFRSVFRERDHLREQQSSPFETEYEVINTTTLAAARELVSAFPGEDVLCLNFASAKNAGGGFLNGSQAQEESLARASGLYFCLNQARGYYENNRHCGTCLYTDHMIYSPQVPVFRNDDDEFLPAPYHVSMITSPAVNFGAIQRRERPRVAEVMLTRIEKLLSLAAVKGHQILVLGAWGCGVFKNDPANVAEWFGHHLQQNPDFNGLFRKVVFAVLDNTSHRGVVTPFEEQFLRGPHS